MNIKISNIQGLIPFKVYLCNGDFEYCQLLDGNFRKTTFEMEYDGILPTVGVKILTSNNKEIKQVFGQQMELFVDCPLSVKIQTSDPTPGNNDGGATITISNAYSTPEILWSSGQNTLNVTGLTAGTYSVTVTDNSKASCFVTKNFTLYENFYLKVENVTSINFSEFISLNDYEIDWGFGFEEYLSTNTTPYKKYQNPYTGVVTIRNTSLLNIKSIVDNYCFGDVVFQSKELSKLSGLTRFETNTTYIDGSFSDLPPSLEKLKIKGNIYGDCSELPINLTELYTYGNVVITGNTVDLPRNLIYANIEKNQISGTTYDLPTSLTSLTISDFTTIEDSTYGLPTGLTKLIIKGNNTISGLIDGLPTNLEQCEIWGYNTIYGDIINLPPNLKNIVIAGNTTISGDTSTLPSALENLYFAGQNTVGGDISILPTSLKFVYLDGVGANPGQIVYGNIDTLNSNIINCTILGNNEVTGELLYTSSHDNLLYLDVEGNNTISGDTANLPFYLRTIRILGQNNLDSFSSGDTRTFWPLISQIYIKPTTAYTEENINNFLQSLATNKAEPSGIGYLVLKGTLNLNNENTKNNYDYLISKGFQINISPTL